jgi:hypothetical protein
MTTVNLYLLYFNIIFLFFFLLSRLYMTWKLAETHVYLAQCNSNNDDPINKPELFRASKIAVVK